MQPDDKGVTLFQDGSGVSATLQGHGTMNGPLKQRFLSIKWAVPPEGRVQVSYELTPSTCENVCFTSGLKADAVSDPHLFSWYVARKPAQSRGYMRVC